MNPYTITLSCFSFIQHFVSCVDHRVCIFTICRVNHNSDRNCCHNFIPINIVVRLLEYFAQFFCACDRTLSLHLRRNYCELIPPIAAYAVAGTGFIYQQFPNTSEPSNCEIVNQNNEYIIQQYLIKRERYEHFPSCHKKRFTRFY